MKKVLLLLLMLSSLSASVAAQTISEHHQKIRQAVQRKDFAAAYQELQNLRKADSNIFEINNFDYLLGRIAEKNNDLATSITAFERVVERKSVLQDYALWHLTRLWRSTGNLMLERLFLQQLLITAPDSLLSKTAAMRLAQSYYESKDYQAVVNQQSMVGSQLSPEKIQPSKPEIQNRELQVLIGQAFLRSGNQDKAREIFTNLVNEIPKPEAPDDFALAAVRSLDELDSAKPQDYGKVAPQLADQEHLRRASIYQFNRAFEEARMHYRAIDERYPNSPNLPFSLLQRGRIAVLEERFDKAIVHFERIQNQFPNSPQARDALAAEASVYARTGSADEAISRYKIFIAKYLDNALATSIENPERPFLNIIDALRDKGRDADALVWIAQTRERFKNQLAATQALFSQTRIHLSQGDWNSSLRDLTELESAPDLGEARVSGGTNKTEITYLKAFCLEQLNRFDESISTYLTIPDGRNEYYGQRATDRLINLSVSDEARDFVLGKLGFYLATAKQAANLNDAERARQAAQNALRLTNNPGVRSELLDIVRRAYSILPAYKNVLNSELLLLGRQKLLERSVSKSAYVTHQMLADEFLFLGLDDEAGPELEAAIKTQKLKAQSLNLKAPNLKTDQLSFTLAVINKRGDLANRAAVYAEPLWRSVPSDYLVELAPRESIELLYPAPYADSLVEFAPPRGVDPRFLLSIMRQESRYRADVKSIAAARGLMQFIPSTAAQIAVQLNQPNFAPNDLYDPATAILFGSQYVQNIFKQFSNQPQAVAASYNGGEANMMRWLLRSKTTDADRYVPEIQFSQSKDYVYKVLANYHTYQLLYDNRLQRR